MVKKTKHDRPDQVIARLLERVDKTIAAAETLREARDALVEVAGVQASAAVSTGREARK